MPPTPDLDTLNEFQVSLVESHVGLAQHLAVAFWKRARNVLDRDELVAIAYQGLISAALRFDPERRPADDPDYDPRLAFGSFARRRITGAIQDWTRSLDHVPKRQRRTYRDIQGLGPGISNQDAADALGIDVERVRAVTYAVSTPPVSLDVLTDAEGHHSTRVGDSGEDALTHLMQQAVAAAFEDMSPEEKSVLALRYYMGYEFRPIAEEMQITLSRVRTIHQEAVAKLHAVMVNQVS